MNGYDILGSNCTKNSSSTSNYMYRCVYIQTILDMNSMTVIQRKKIQHQFKEFGVASLTHKSWQITYEVIINYSLGKL